MKGAGQGVHSVFLPNGHVKTRYSECVLVQQHEINPRWAERFKNHFYSIFTTHFDEKTRWFSSLCWQGSQHWNQSRSRTSPPHFWSIIVLPPTFWAHHPNTPTSCTDKPRMSKFCLRVFFVSFQLLCRIANDLSLSGKVASSVHPEKLDNKPLLSSAVYKLHASFLPHSSKRAHRRE